MRTAPWQSLTVRLTALATAGTALVLFVVLAGVLTVFSTQIAAGVDDGLQVRLRELTAVVLRDGPAAVGSDVYAALYDGNRLEAGSSTIGAAGSLLPGPPTLACPEQRLFDRSVQLAARDEPVPLRVLAGCLPDGRVLAVAASVEPQEEARERLLVLLALAAPVLLALVALTVGRAVHSALRPVDALTRLAARISAGSDTERRIPTTPGNDEIGRLARTLDDMLGRLAVAFARERSFVDDASHELRLPLAVLRGEIELALSDLADTDGVEQSLRAALAEAERLSRLTEDLLVLARQHPGHPQPASARAGSSAVPSRSTATGTATGHEQAPDPAGSELHAVLTETARRLARTSPLTLSIDTERPLYAQIEPAGLERVLSNLLGNAQAAGASTVRLTARRVAGAADTSRRVPALLVALDVEDDGPGFPPDFLPVAFERFSRADTARTRGSGAGLGLSMVRALVVEAGGTVTADNDSALGGAAVRVRLVPGPG